MTVSLATDSKSFSSFEELTSRLNEEQILAVVNKFFEERKKRTEHHKAYNAKRNAQLRLVKQLAAEKGMSVDELVEML